MSSPLLQVKLIFNVGFFFTSPPVLPDMMKKIDISSYDFEGYYGPYFLLVPITCTGMMRKASP